MNLVHRIARLEARAPDPRQCLVPFTLDGVNDERARQRYEDAVARGHPVKAIRVGLCIHADTQEEADEVLAKHKAEHPTVPLSVFRLRDQVKTTLAEWNPPLPAWLEPTAS